MDFQRYIGTPYFDHELYELLLFEIESNFDKFNNNFMHLYFEELADGKIRIMEIKEFESIEAGHKATRKLKKDTNFFEIYHAYECVSLEYCTVQKLGKSSSIYSGWTHTQDGGTVFLEDLNLPPLSEDEMKEAFRELAELFYTETEKQELRLKKTV